MRKFLIVQDPPPFRFYPKKSVFFLALNTVIGFQELQKESKYSIHGQWPRGGGDTSSGATISPFLQPFSGFKAHLFLIESKSTVFQSLEDINQHWGDPGLHHHFPHPDILFLGLKSLNGTKTRAVWAILGPTWAGSMAGLYTAPRQTPLLPEEHNTRHGTASRETPVTGLKSLEYGNEFMG